MKQQPDNLFHKKLSSYSKPAPSLAWNKIETNLDKKKHKGIWLKVAASLLIIGATGAIITLTLPDQPATIAQVELTTPPVKTDDEVHAMPESISEGVSKESSADPTVSDANKISPVKAPIKTLTKIKTEHTTAEAIKGTSEHATPETTVTKTSPLSGDAEENVVASTDQTSTLEETLTSQSKNTESITLVFSAAETTEYLDKKINESVEATSPEKKTSTFQKLLRKASDLKTNQDPFGDLRQKKNEILALNFKSDKKRGQKNN